MIKQRLIHCVDRKGYPLSPIDCRLSKERYTVNDASIFQRLLPWIIDDTSKAGVYNPVFCCGTQIAIESAVKWTETAIANHQPEARIVRINGSAFICRSIHIVKERGNLFSFVKSCCGGDVLILTEPEAIAGKKRMSENLYYILDDYLLHNRSIFSFALTPPGDIPELAPRIRAQLEGGILLDLGEKIIGRL